VKALNWKSHQKGTLLGFFDLLLDSGLEVRGMTCHQKDGKSWVSFPAKPYEAEDGSTRYQSILRIPDDRRWKSFQEKAREAVAKIRKNGGEEGSGDVSF
jgi:hypothetical protein